MLRNRFRRDVTCSTIGAPTCDIYGPLCEIIRLRGKIPVICGSTMVPLLWRAGVPGDGRVRQQAGPAGRGAQDVAAGGGGAVAGGPPGPGLRRRAVPARTPQTYSGKLQHGSPPRFCVLVSQCRLCAAASSDHAGRSELCAVSDEHASISMGRHC